MNRLASIVVGLLVASGASAQIGTGGLIVWSGTSRQLYNGDFGGFAENASSNSPFVSFVCGTFHTLAYRADGSVLAWGRTQFGQCAPQPTEPFRQVAAGEDFNVYLRSNGTVFAIGANAERQCEVPAGLSHVVQVAAGGFHTVALKDDGTVVAWGDNYWGQCNVPPGLSGVVSIGAGVDFTVCVKADGSLVAFGNNTYGQCNIPSNPPAYRQLVVGGYATYALLWDGTVRAWGDNYWHQSDVPAGLTGVVSIAAGGGHALALKADGTVVAWGLNDRGQATVPAGLKGVQALRAGFGHSVALLRDGSLVAWGDTEWNQSSVPRGFVDVRDMAVGVHVLAIRGDGKVAAWGLNDQGQCNVPPSLSDVVQVAAGENHSLALTSNHTIVGWGYDGYRQSSGPQVLTDAVQISAGPNTSIVRRTNGTLRLFGINYGLKSIAESLTGVTRFSVEPWARSAVAQLADGSFVAWSAYPDDTGRNKLPPDLANVAQFAAGYGTNLFVMNDGRVLAFGNDWYSNDGIVPAKAMPSKQVAAAFGNGYSLKTDGTIVAWGKTGMSSWAQPKGLSGIARIDAGALLAAALPGVRVRTDVHSLGIGGQRTATVFLPEDSNSARTVVLSADPGIQVATSVTVPAGSHYAAAEFSVQPGAVSGPAEIRASFGGFTAHARFVIAPQGQEIVYPATANASQGTLTEGGLNELLFQDDLRYGLAADAEGQAAVEITGHSATVGASRLELRFEAQANRDGIWQRVEFFDWAANKWVQVQGAVANRYDLPASASTAQAVRFTNADGTVKARLRWSLVNDEEPAQDPWRVLVDQVYWVVER